MKNILLLFAALTLVIISSTDTRADLIDRGKGLIYDTALDITWLQNANQAGQTFTWYDADQWADDLVFQGYDDWRLPGISDSCTGYNCSEGEMGHLFYNDSINADNPGPFSDVRSYMYWSGTDYHEDETKAWRFHFNTGYSGNSSKTQKRYAWAVRDGDLSAPVAPEPLSSLLFVTGGVVFSAKRFRKRKQQV